MRLYDVCYQVGYLSPSYFSRLFKKQTVCRPENTALRRFSEQSAEREMRDEREKSSNSPKIREKITTKQSPRRIWSKTMLIMVLMVLLTLISVFVLFRFSAEAWRII